MAVQARAQQIYDADSGEIDRTQLKRVAASFARLHARRLANAKETLSPAKRRVLAALPTLMHLNHPLLPGFCGHNVPAGIDLYQPSAHSLHTLRSFTQIRIDRLRERTSSIRAIYLMGSTGSIAQTRTSDLDVWVVAPQASHHRLDRKLVKITDWAGELGVELQAFCVDPNEFRQGQSPLLLDEFYRSAIHVAGRYPLWWLIPPEADYDALAARIVQQRFVNPDHYVDFGRVKSFERNELLEAALRELGSSLATPHKSLLKLALLACYDEGATPLSSEFKRRALLEPKSEIDSYVLLADLLDDSFCGTRRDLLRRAWLTKTLRSNSHLNKSDDWRIRSHRWGYDDLDIDTLRWPERWSLTDLFSEQHRLLAEYAHAFTFALRLASELRHTESRSVALDKVRRIALELSPQFKNTPRTLLPVLVPAKYHGHAEVRQTRQGRWVLRDAQSVIHEHARLVGVLAWLPRNRFTLQALTFTQRRDPRFQQIYGALMRNNPVVIVNAESTALLAVELEGKSLVTSLDNPLSYGANGAVLVKQLDIVDSNRSAVATFTDVRECLCALVSLELAGKTPSIYAIGDIRRHRLQQKLRLLLHDTTRALRRGSVFGFVLGGAQCLVYWNSSHAFPSWLSVPLGQDPGRYLPTGTRIEFEPVDRPPPALTGMPRGRAL